MKNKVPHVSWIDHFSIDQKLWIEDQLLKKSFPKDVFLKYIRGDYLSPDEKRDCIDMAKSLGNYWRSTKSREGKTTITLSKNAAMTIRSYSEQQNIAVTSMMESYAKSLKSNTGLYPSNFTEKAKIVLLSEIETTSRLVEELTISIGELANDDKPAKVPLEAISNRVEGLLGEIEQHLEKMKGLASSRNKRKKQYA